MGLPIDVPSVSDHVIDASMLCVLGKVLRSGTFDNEDVELLAAIANDGATEAAERIFARQAMRWLAQQSSAFRGARIWMADDDARH